MFILKLFINFNPQIMIQKTTLLRITKFTFCFLSVILLFSAYSFKTLVPINAIEETVPFSQTDVVPVFKGCDQELTRNESIDCFNQKMDNHINKYLKYPDKAVKNGIQGKVEITFIIDTEGIVKDIKTTSPDETGILEKEAVRIISLLPIFQPGIHRGELVNVRYNIPLTFKIN